MADRTGKPNYRKEDRDQIIDLHLQGLVASKISAQLKNKYPIRSITKIINDYQNEQRIKESVKRVLEDKVVEVTLQAALKAIAARKQWLMEEALKIWEKLPETEKHTSRVFLKLMELAQKDDELLLKPLCLPDALESGQAGVKSEVAKKLEEKLNQLNAEIHGSSNLEPEGPKQS